MPTINDIAQFIEAFAPPALAESWDNVGLLVGDRAARVERVMTCLTITPASADEAIAAGAQLIVSHHPLPFKPLRQLSTDTPEGRLLWRLIGAGISIYRPHTAFDSAAAGINQHLAIGLQLLDVVPLVVRDVPGLPNLGSGRAGRLARPMSLVELAQRAKQFLNVDQLQVVEAAGKPIERVAVACGSAGEFLPLARQAGCQCLLTGETRFHTCLEAEATGIDLILCGHYASERFGVERLAESLVAQFPGLSIWPSRQEADPLRWI